MAVLSWGETFLFDRELKYFTHTNPLRPIPEGGGTFYRRHMFNWPMRSERTAIGAAPIDVEAYPDLGSPVRTDLITAMNAMLAAAANRYRASAINLCIGPVTPLDARPLTYVQLSR